MLATVPLVFIDTETTSLNANRRAWEVGLIRREPDGAEIEIQFFVDVSLKHADLISLGIGGYYDRHPRGVYLTEPRRGAPYVSDFRQWVDHSQPGRLFSQRDAATIVAKYLHGAHVIGSVVNFDTEVLGKMLRRHRLILSSHYHLVDVEALAVGYLAHQFQSAPFVHRAKTKDLPPTTGPDGEVAKGTRKITPPWVSDEIAGLLRIDPPTEEERHTALGDAKWAMRVYDKVMGN